MAIKFVCSDWTANNPNFTTWKKNNPWFEEWYEAEYHTEPPALVKNTNAFSSFSDALKKNPTNGDVLVLCSNASYTEGSVFLTTDEQDFTVVAAKSDFSLTVSGYITSGWFATAIAIDGNMTIAEGTACTITGDAGMSITGGNSLTVNGTLSGTELSAGSGNVTVNGNMTVNTYSGSGNLTVGDGATVNITNYSGTGTITLDGNGTLNITNISSGATVHIDVEIDPDTTGALPYAELMSNNSINFRTAVSDFASKPVCVTNNNHTLYYAPKDYYYVNSGYTGSAIPDVLAASGMYKTTVAAAVTAAGTAGSVFVTGGTFGVATAGQAVAFNGLNAQILGVVTGSPDKIVNGSARFTSSVAGGECITNTAKFKFVKAAGEDTHLEINGGTFGKTVVGGDFVTQGSAVRTGNIYLTINGGEFVSTVGGGMAYTPKEDSSGNAELSGNVKFLITGGTFNRRIYGGNICCNGRGGQTSLTGSVNLTIDASKNDIVFKDHIVAGCFDQGAIDGSTSVTLKGSGAHLKGEGNVAFNKTILGGSGATYITTGGGTRVCHSFVSGSRNFAFEGFTGEFAGEIKAFQNISFTKGAAVQFTNEALNLQDISSWSLAYGSSLTATKGSNNFSGDSLALDLTGWNNNAWTVMSGTEDFFGNWDAFGSVTLGGQTATYANGKWASTNYQLTLETSSSTKMLVLATKS